MQTWYLLGQSLVCERTCAYWSFEVCHLCTVHHDTLQEQGEGERPESHEWDAIVKRFRANDNKLLWRDLREDSSAKYQLRRCFVTHVCVWEGADTEASSSGESELCVIVTRVCSEVTLSEMHEMEHGLMLWIRMAISSVEVYSVKNVM
jgi:hypothetical protein